MTTYQTFRIHQHTINTPYGILDLHFSPTLGSEFAVATSVGSIVHYRCDPQDFKNEEVSEMTFAQTKTTQLFDKSILVTSFSWDPVNLGYFGATTTTGQVVVADAEGQSLHVVHEHSLEAWIVAYPRLDRSLDGIWSGGDDAFLSFAESPWVDRRSCLKSLETMYKPMSWSNGKLHGAGVTAIIQLTNEFIATGSYDDCLRIIRQPHLLGARPQTVKEVNLGGGVWRLKIIQESKQESTYEAFVLASCMYAGSYILSLQANADGTKWDIDIVAKFDEHQSMNYAGDVHMDGHSVVTSSFYDRRLCLWHWR